MMKSFVKVSSPSPDQSSLVTIIKKNTNNFVEAITYFILQTIIIVSYNQNLFSYFYGII